MRRELIDACRNAVLQSMSLLTKRKITFVLALHELDLADAFKVVASGVGDGYAGEIRSEGSLDYADWDQMTIVR